MRPKSLWNYEVGARFVRGRVLLNGSVFYADVRGEFVPRSTGGVSQPENASRSRNVGVELGVTARATRHVELMASYAFLDLRLLDYKSTVLDSTTNTFQPVDFSGKLLPNVPRHRLTGEVRATPVPNVDLGAQIEWQGVVYVESGNADAGTWYFRSPPSVVRAVAFRAVPARALVHLNATWQLGPATVFGSVENLFGVKYTGNVIANEAAGRFYESGSPAWLSLGMSLTGWATSDSR